MSMSLKRFMGWEPTEVHEYEYHPNGALARIIVTREPEWDDEQRQVALDHLDRERMTRACGHHPALAMDPNVGRLVQHDRFLCLDCKAEDEQRSAWIKKNHPTHKELLKAAGEDPDGSCRYCSAERFWVEEYVPATPPSKP